MGNYKIILDMKHHLQQRIFGGLAFVIALMTYLLTLEPSASFWDCSEFIACAYKLEIGHAPGAPLYMLLGRLFSLLAFGNTENVAVAINALSAVASALTVLLLFHIIYWFVSKLLSKSKPEIKIEYIHFMAVAASLIGSLSFAFTDSFWFSAVEAEVYATSVLFSALVFWCITKYEQEPRGWRENRWLVLIFFLLGLSVGVHLLNLLALPAMALVVYFKHYRHSTLKLLATLGLSGLLIVVFVYGIIPGVVKSAAYFDLVFVNFLKMPVYSGVLSFIIILVSGILLLMHYFNKNKKYLSRFALLLFSFWLIGYSSFAVLVIRSADNPFIDINNVENVFGLVDYLNREQYGQRPLIYGHNFNTPIVDSKKRFTYKLLDKTYFQDELNPEYKYDEHALSFFPRMSSSEPRHVDAYKKWVTIKGRNLKVTGADGVSKTINVPTFLDNFRFFIKYQLGQMYFRYFMWNFAGRQNDTQGYGDAFFGNWISGIPWLDNLRLGQQNEIADDFKNQKAQNKYYLIPLLIGILGMLYHLKHDKRNFWIALTLFICTGPAIVIYLNEVPITPRERDYVHVGSFMVFAIWIGLGAAALLQESARYIKKPFVKWAITGILLIIVPGLIGSQNWDDHDRSDRYAARDFGKNMLSSCAQNAILFTAADNDTYPIWYLQQVENFRPDVRQVLTTFLPIEWYGNQLNNEYPGCGSVPISFKNKELLMKTNQFYPVTTRIDSAIEVKEMIQFIRNSDKRTRIKTREGEYLNYIPGKKLSLAVDAENFLTESSYIAMDKEDVPAKIYFSINKNYLSRDELLLLDILANNNWKRPVFTIYPQVFHELGLADYLHREGMLFRLLPYKNNNVLHNRKAFAQHQYELITEKFVWGNVNSSSVFIDHTIKQIGESFRFREMFVDVAEELILLNEFKMAEELIDLAQNIFPRNNFKYSYYSPRMAACYYLAGAKNKGDALVEDIFKSASQNLNYFLCGKPINRKDMSHNVQLEVYLMQELIRLSDGNNIQLRDKLIVGFEQFL
ncbi:MAG: DUF2723 domain-containing protein [Bacteroidales bacterium]|jgi:hypothetical protein|nr:DUF2723 domain-containing protein [Bacteroidales bacterium]